MARARIRERVKCWQGVVEACEEAPKLKPGDPEAERLLVEARRHVTPARALTLDLGGDVTMELVPISPGESMMGSLDGEAQRSAAA